MLDLGIQDRQHRTARLRSIRIRPNFELCTENANCGEAATEQKRIATAHSSFDFQEVGGTLTAHSGFSRGPTSDRGEYHLQSFQKPSRTFAKSASSSWPSLVESRR